MSLDAIILAGGFGTRLRPVVSGIPKTLAPIRGKPFLDLLLESLGEKKRITRVILAVGFQSEVIQDHYRTHSFRFSIDYSMESTALGTGGAVRLALEKIKSNDVLILNGDSFIEFDLQSFVNFHHSHQSLGTLLLTQVEHRSRYGSVLVDPKNNKVLGFEEKRREGSGLVNAGVYLIRRSAFMHWPLGNVLSMEKDLLPELIQIQGLYGMKTKKKFIDIGTPESFEEAQTSGLFS